MGTWDMPEKYPTFQRYNLDDCDRPLDSVYGTAGHQKLRLHLNKIYNTVLPSLTDDARRTWRNEMNNVNWWGDTKQIMPVLLRLRILAFEDQMGLLTVPQYLFIAKASDPKVQKTVQELWTMYQVVKEDYNAQRKVQYDRLVR